MRENISDLEKLKILHDMAEEITAEHWQLLRLSPPATVCPFQMELRTLADNPRQ